MILFAKKSMRGKDIEEKEGMLTERERTGDTRGEQEHREQEKRRRNYRLGLRKQTEGGEGEQRLIKMQREEREKRMDGMKEKVERQQK